MKSEMKPKEKVDAVGVGRGARGSPEHRDGGRSTHQKSGEKVTVASGSRDSNR